MVVLNVCAGLSLLSAFLFLLLNAAEIDLLRSKFRKFYLIAFRVLATLSVGSILATAIIGLNVN